MANGLGDRLRLLRAERDLTLAEVAEQTAISVSTLSRLESGGRRATLELLLPLARTYAVTLDDLVDAPATGDPRVHLRPRRTQWATIVPLSNRPGGTRVFKQVIDPRRCEPDPRSHDGYEWLYVVDGRLRLVLGDHDLVLGPGEVAEFDTRTPHWFGCADARPTEILSIFGPQGERMHVRARPK
ncbi:XRE family transcriptional regulator [Nocardioides mangrovicus]|uniref:XRE family transcriptional regulator n=1 Tax=Nocardioides mangrovicus TaxID=2478913 RepID=A0A3L8P7A4_9ACTN|nr:XRE family transcriptional regulator [Nocardioides mangrovicus]RLV51131.1 XRE family transcriptional regulator [Nocardioides mangrovicus]